MPILVVEQNASLEICHRACVLETGRLRMEGKGVELLHDPRVMQRYLGIAD